jgi:two-component system, LuxR family, response regulator FixJ
LKTGRISTGVIAIVDDDQPFREALASVLKASGFGVITYGSAEEFLGSFGSRATSCLVLDVRLPGMSGIELQRHMIEAGKSVPIIFVTGHGDDSLRDLLMKTGAEGFLTKPVRSDMLLAKIGAVISKTAED